MTDIFVVQTMSKANFPIPPCDLILSNKYHLEYMDGDGCSPLFSPPYHSQRSFRTPSNSWRLHDNILSSRAFK